MKNIIILHTDQQRFDSLGINGNVYQCTPNIDALAEDGCNVMRHIATNTTCMPSRASLLTGLYVPGHGVSSNGIPLWRDETSAMNSNNIVAQTLFNCRIPEKIPTMADYLKTSGYNTALFGKLHLQPHLADSAHRFYESYDIWNRPETENLSDGYYGFDTYKVILGHGEAPCGYNRGHYGRWLIKNHPLEYGLVNPGGDMNTITQDSKGDIFVSNLSSKYHNSMWLADEACNYLEKNKKEPTFMFVGFPDPHHPYSAPKDIAKNFLDCPVPSFPSAEDVEPKRATAAMKQMESHHATDADIAKAYRLTMASIYLLDRAVGQIINKLKELNIYDNTLIVFTSDHGDYLGDCNMLAKSNIAHNNLLHVPLIIKGTKDNQLPTSLEKQVSNVDVLPTIFNMASIPVPKLCQGVDIFSEEESYPMATCYGIVPEEQNITLYDAQYRYTYYPLTGEEELYDHWNDLHELSNIANQKLQKCKKMKEMLLEKHLGRELGIFNHYGLW